MKGGVSKDYLVELDKAGIGYREIVFLDEKGNWYIAKENNG